MRKRNFKIGKLEIGLDKKTIIVAELSGNHKGKISYAKKLIKMAKKSGADAVKLQSYTANSITLDVKKKDFEIEGSSPWAKHTYLWDLYKKAETPISWHKKLFDYARKINIEIFSSPFDETAVDFLESFDLPAYKIASPEIVDLNLITRCAETRKPLIISTGMANLEEINEALSAAYEGGAKEIVLLHCVSAYPTPLEESNLSAITTLKEKFDIPVGLSDHTSSTLTTLVAVGLGAVLIEKHITLSRDNNGLDDAFSLEPDNAGRSSP